MNKNAVVSNFLFFCSMALSLRFKALPAPSGRGLPPQRLGERAYRVYAVSGGGEVLSLRPAGTSLTEGGKF